MTLRANPESPKVKKISFFFCGTWSTSKEKKDIRRGGSFRHAHAVMYNEKNIIVEAARHCKDKAYIFDGPGTDIFQRDNPSPLMAHIQTVGGGISGEVGSHSIPMTLQKAKEILLAEKKSAGNDVTLDIEIWGWSRGAITAGLFKQAAEELGIKAKFTCKIDPVPGGPTDRVAHQNRQDEIKQKQVVKNADELDSDDLTFFSTTGNMDAWEASEPSPRAIGLAATAIAVSASLSWGVAPAVAAGALLAGRTMMSSMPFFSAYHDPSKSGENVLLDANHEVIAGNSRHLQGKDAASKHKAAVGDVVIGYSIARAVKKGASYDIDWQLEIYKKALEGLDNYKEGATTSPVRAVVDKMAPSTLSMRRILTPQAPLMGHALTDVKDLKRFHDVKEKMRNEINNGIDTALKQKFESMPIKQKYENMALLELNTHLEQLKEKKPSDANEHKLLQMEQQYIESHIAIKQKYENMALLELNTHLEQLKEKKPSDVNERKLLQMEQQYLESRIEKLIHLTFQSLLDSIEGHSFELRGGGKKREDGSSKKYSHTAYEISNILINAIKNKKFDMESFREVYDKCNGESGLLKGKLETSGAKFIFSTRTKPTVALYRALNKGLNDAYGISSSSSSVTLNLPNVLEEQSSRKNRK